MGEEREGREGGWEEEGRGREYAGQLNIRLIAIIAGSYNSN